MGTTLVAVWTLLQAIVGSLVAALRPRASLVAENLALRQQLAILHRATPRPHLRPIDRAFWVVLLNVWSRWRDVLAIVKPATVIGWHRRAFARFWAWKSRRIGRPPLADEIVALIGRMARENPTWSRRRITSELAKLGFVVSKDTVAKYMPKPPKRPLRPPSQTWKTFLRNAADRRGAGPDAPPVERLIRDRDGVFGTMFDARVERLGLRQLRIAPRSPWQNGFAERWVGTLRRELLDHLIVLGERHHDRPHMALGGDAPMRRAVEKTGAVVALRRVGGLHHRYSRAA